MARYFSFPPEQIISMDGPELRWWGDLALEVMQAESQAMKEAMGGR
jgi:hypothetical protein